MHIVYVGSYVMEDIQITPAGGRAKRAHLLVFYSKIVNQPAWLLTLLFTCNFTGMKHDTYLNSPVVVRAV